MGRFLWAVFAILDGVLIALFLAGYAARFVHPETLWWLQLVAIGLPYLAAVVLASTAVVALARRWHWFGLHLVLVVLIAVRFVSPERLISPADAGGETLRVLTYNLPKEYAPNSSGEILELVSAEAFDLIVLQEATAVVRVRPRWRGIKVGTNLRPLVDSLGYRVFGPETNYNRIYYQPMLSRFDLADFTETPLRRADDDQGGSFVSRAVFTWQGRQAVVYNLHLRTYGEKKPWRDENRQLFDLGFWVKYARQYRAAILGRVWEAEQVRQRIDQETLPVIVCGDFNSTPHNWVYRRIAEGLQDTFAEAGQGWGGTYHVSQPLFRIDYVLASPAWQVRRARVGYTSGSDHRPLMVHLSWQ